MTEQTIGKKKFDELGIRISDWMIEEGFETNSSQNLDLIILILECLEIKYDSKLIEKLEKETK